MPHARRETLRYIDIKLRSKDSFMKTLISIVVGLLAAYLTLAWAVGHLDAVSSATCHAEFTLPAIACGFVGLGITILLIPLSGIAAFIATRMALSK